jgi:hypothetical protein
MAAIVASDVTPAHERGAAWPVPPTFADVRRRSAIAGGS